MDQKLKFHVVEEEETSGWTILRTVRDEELQDTTVQRPDPELKKDSVETSRAGNESTLGTEEKSHEEDDFSDDAEEVLFSEGGNYADDELTDCGVDEGAEEEGSPFSDSAARTYVWETDHIGDVGGKQTLVQQPVQKQGLMWRISLVATLGLFGWAILSGLGCGGKNVRCLKMHPCSLKEGEPVLSSM